METYTIRGRKNREKKKDFPLIEIASYANGERDAEEKPGLTVSFCEPFESL
jgi:hypothetical protein